MRNRVGVLIYHLSWHVMPCPWIHPVTDGTGLEKQPSREAGWPSVVADCAQNSNVCWPAGRSPLSTVSIPILQIVSSLFLNAHTIFSWLKKWLLRPFFYQTGNWTQSPHGQGMPVAVGFLLHHVGTGHATRQQRRREGQEGEAVSSPADQWAGSGPSPPNFVYSQGRTTRPSSAFRTLMPQVTFPSKQSPFSRS